MSGKLIPFTVDVEDGINLVMRDQFNVKIEPTPRVVSNTNRILDLLLQYHIKATFFILGHVAHKYPSIVKRLVIDGHEVGVHSYDHNKLFKLSPKEVKEDIYKAKNIIENITGEKVKGFRAPTFSILPTTSWILEIIAELGFEYDSSIYPNNIFKSGWPGFIKAIQTLKLKSNMELIEVPLSTLEIFGFSVPAGGGGYLRLFPYWYTVWALKKIQNKNRLPMVYLHPYEVDIDLYPPMYYEYLRKSTFKKQFHLISNHYNRKTVILKLEKLLNAFSFERLDRIIENHKENNNLIETYIH